jgi:ribonucleotide reductase class II
VAGNIRRSAGMRQFSSTDNNAIHSKEGLYTQDKQGNWKVDPNKEALRMANHTICYHEKPSLETITESVRKQFYSGEGAIQFVPEAVARANADILNTKERQKFVELYCNYGRERAKQYLITAAGAKSISFDRKELAHRMGRYGLNPCGEIIGKDFHCNLAEVHLNTIDPQDSDAQYKAFYAAGLQVAALLQHEFIHERYQYSRKIDPIVGVSFTGLFDFFVHAFGADWLRWMMEDRPCTDTHSYQAKEKEYLEAWRKAAHAAVYDYCTEHELRIPNRITTVQPAGTKSLLTGASSGWHPPKAQRFIRRITFGKQDPLVAALRDWGYSVIPAPSARDEEGNLLDDIHDPRVSEVLVEIPTEVSWANLPGCDIFDLSKLSAVSQFKLYHQVQSCYTDHNTSATIEFREHEIDALSELIHTHIGKGYISAALLARFDANATFPRLPFEPITKQQYDEMIERVNAWRLSADETLGFTGVLAKYDHADFELTTEAACTSAACIAQAEREDTKVS